MFEQLKFDDLNETDVREEIVAPLVRSLGYRSGTKNNVIREQSLRYPRAFLGHKNPGKDPILRGKADYILEADGKVRWVIEAKAPDVSIGSDEIEQAWSYASHPEIRAVYFVLCNGRTLKVFQTNQGPATGPLLEISYDDFQKMYPQIENVLGPTAVLRDHPPQKIDTGIPLGAGLRSVVRITNGLIQYKQNSLGLVPLNELQITIADGAVERDEDGGLIAYVKTISPSKTLQELNERLGLTAFEMSSQDNTLSTDINKPTVLVYQKTITLPAGEQILDLQTWKTVTLPMNIRCNVNARATGVLENRRFHGTFTTDMNYLEAGLKVDMAGAFEVHLA